MAKIIKQNTVTLLKKFWQSGSYIFVYIYIYIYFFFLSFSIVYGRQEYWKGQTDAFMAPFSVHICTYTKQIKPCILFYFLHCITYITRCKTDKFPYLFWLETFLETWFERCLGNCKLNIWNQSISSGLFGTQANIVFLRKYLTFLSL